MDCEDQLNRQRVLQSEENDKLVQQCKNEFGSIINEYKAKLQEQNDRRAEAVQQCSQL